MGFEQLAALKSQLAAQAKSAKPKKTNQPSKAAHSPKPAHAQKPAHAPKSAQPPRQAAAKANASATPVDPVVHTIGKLQKKFPRAFPKNPAPKLPLKVGILEDLLKQAADLRLTERELRDAIAVWCRGNRYRACLVQGAPRVDLLGEPAGDVTAGEAAHARRSAGGKASAQGKGKAEAAPVANAEAEADATPDASANTDANANANATPDEAAAPRA